MSKSFFYQITVTPELLVDKVRNLAGQYGVIFSGDTFEGSMSGKGFKGEYKISGNQIVITIQEKPFIIPWGMVEGALKDFV